MIDRLDLTLLMPVKPGSAVFNGGTYQPAIHANRTQASAGRHVQVTLQ